MYNNRLGKKINFPASWAKFPPSRVDIPPLWGGFLYVFLYFFPPNHKFPGQELCILPVFSRPGINKTYNSRTKNYIHVSVNIAQVFKSGGTQILRQTGMMWRSNGLLFYKKSLKHGSHFLQKNP